jgi:hypothetical protein
MSLPIRADSRQIPKHRDYTTNKQYDDLMYGYLQSISFDDFDGYRYVNAADVSFTKLGTALKISRPTATNRFKGLKSLMLVAQEKDRGKYRLEPLANEYALLVPNDVLKKLVDYKISHLISIYVYLLLRYTALYEPYPFKFSTLKEYIGISADTYSNSGLITERLDILQNIALLGYEEKTIKNQFTPGYHSEQWVLWMRNHLYGKDNEFELRRF